LGKDGDFWPYLEGKNARKLAHDLVSLTEKGKERKLIIDTKTFLMMLFRPCHKFRSVCISMVFTFQRSFTEAFLLLCLVEIVWEVFFLLIVGRVKWPEENPWSTQGWRDNKLSWTLFNGFLSVFLVICGKIV
jgi:hypothetical protein